ncbi:hypothetical protein JWV37_06895 [Sulfurospirillum sp. T05]|uniref:Uncharacterized protein n=1 Tax=Sulfurospirillum tamanense TaxID=2813362 RepID=A0ABS2WS47_9BACT|nr:hypothetical protein [Sulfurospirillum tamanensis]MBN2964501.1 hypothetical protein [Sulfurospirillum tamanensis]
MTRKHFFFVVSLVLFGVFSGELYLLYNSSISSSSFTAVTGFATPAFHSNHLFLRHPLTQPPWSVFDTHPELREHVRGSFVQTGILP